MVVQNQAQIRTFTWQNRPGNSGLQIMSTVARTERLTLRQFTLEDAADLFELNSDPEVIRYTGDLPVESVEAAEQFLDNYSAYAQTGFGRWAVIRNSDKRFVGWCGLKLNEESLNDLGFRFFRDCWGKGYATESARASLDLGFGQFHLDEIIGRTAKQNHASMHVLEKLGMQKWKTGECEGFPDALYYRIDERTYRHHND